MTLEQITLTAALAFLIGRFETSMVAEPQAKGPKLVAIGLLGSLIVLGFVLLWNSLLRSN